MSKMGRPPIRGEAADKQLKLWVSAQEHERIKEAAREAGKSMNQWVIGLALAAASDEQQPDG